MATAAELLSSLNTNLTEPDMLKAKYAPPVLPSSEPDNKTAPLTDDQKKLMAQTAAAGMSSGGSLGGILTGAGVAGLALSLYEQKKQADAAEENARIQEQQNRKTAVQNAISNALSATKMLGV